MSKIIFPVTLLLTVLGIALAADDKSGKAAAPLKVLLIAGGCCHDYPGQCEVLKAGIESKINAEVTVDLNEDKSTKAIFSTYDSDDWAKNYDVVIHDECSADVTDPAYVKRILDAHRGGVPAVNLHCGMHSYRWGDFREPVKPGAENARWYEMIGIQSTAHGPKAPIDIAFSAGEHPITKGMGDWTTIDEELYNNVQIFDSAQALASGTQMQMPKKKKGEKADPDAKPAKASAVVVWTNEYGPENTKIFSTTLGHFTETVADERYLDLVTRGLLWTVGKLNADGTPAEGYGR